MSKPDYHKLRFEEIVDRFALRLTEEEKERLVQLYDLPPIYFTKSRVQVFRALRMLGIYGFDNPEGLLSIGDVLQRRDVVSEFQEELRAIRKSKMVRKSSTVVNLEEIYSNFHLPPTLDVSLDHIEILKANVQLLKKIANYRYKDDPLKRRRIKFHLENAWHRLTDVTDCLALAGDEAGCGDELETLKRGIPETQPPAGSDLLAASTVTSTAPGPLQGYHHNNITEKEPESTTLYENVGAPLGRRGSAPPVPSRHSSAGEITVKSSPKQRRDSVPHPKPASPAPQTKLPHNLHSNARQQPDPERSEREAGSESPKRKPAPIPKPKPIRASSQHQFLTSATMQQQGKGETADYTGSGDSGYGDESWPKPQGGEFAARLDHHLYQQLLQKNSPSTEENEYAEPGSPHRSTFPLKPTPPHKPNHKA